MDYREKMREYLKEPDVFSSQYGKWGALNKEQREYIRRLLDEMDRADIYIRQLYEENMRLKKELNLHGAKRVINELEVKDII